MARIPMRSGFKLIDEGEYVFRIYEVDYDEDFGKLKIKLVNAEGNTTIENFTLKTNDDDWNEKALNAFSYFAKTALNDFDREDIDPDELVDCYIRAEIVHNTSDQGNTFANLGEKSPADGFDTEPTERAMSLGKDKTESTTKAEKKSNDNVNLDDLLG